MIKLFTFLMLALASFLVVSAPWFSALVYSTVSVMQPQYIWFWAFDGFSVFKFSAGIAIIAWGIQAARGNINWSAYSSGQFYGMVALLIIFHLSSLLTPFQDYSAQTGGELVVDIFTTIAIMYFIVLGVLNDTTKLRYFFIMFIVITLYYTYWANNHYLAGNWYQFYQGRLTGPPGGPYRDGNALSIVLTIGLSFVMFGIRFFKQTWIKVVLLLSIPLVLHALILFASRGALLSAACLTLFFAYVVKSKTLNIFIGVGFVAMIIWQGGELLNRTTSTVEQAQSKSEEQALNPRLVSWQIGANLALKYPLLGAGPQRFQYASRVHYPEKAKHVAHNTFLNFSANTGLIAGFVYLMFFYTSFKQYRFVLAHVEKDSMEYTMNQACMGALVAFFVGAVFLDLIIFEPFYCVLVLMSVNYSLVKQKADIPSTQSSTISTGRAVRSV